MGSMVVRTGFSDWVVGALVEPAWDYYERSVRLKTFRELQRSQWWDSNRLESLHRNRLAAIVNHACSTSKFYRERFADAGIDPKGVRDIGDLSSLPLLTKRDVRERASDVLSTDYRVEDLVPAKTGGSTGVALRVYCDRRGVERRNGAAMRGNTWSGWRLGQSVAAVWGNPPVPRTWRNRLRAALKDRFIYLDTMHIDDDAIAQFVREWQTLKPGLLYGHAHSVYILAEALRGRNEGIRPKGIVTSSMMLLSHERRLIEEVFGVAVINRYGCEEVSLIACQCEQHGSFHLNHEHCAVEFLRDDGQPCLPGEDGRIVVTEFVNRGMPMIRYEVGDRGTPGEGLCPCGRGLPLMDGLTGRVADFLRALDGSRVAGVSLIENTLTRFGSIEQMQIVQDDGRKLRINLVPASGYDNDTEQSLISVMKRALGQAMQVDVVKVASIPQEPSGKYRFAICTLDNEIR
jgi:phenylacetate-CoA ligase